MSSSAAGFFLARFDGFRCRVSSLGPYTPSSSLGLFIPKPLVGVASSSLVVHSDPSCSFGPEPFDLSSLVAHSVLFFWGPPELLVMSLLVVHSDPFLGPEPLVGVALRSTMPHSDPSPCLSDPELFVDVVD